jgi:protein-S-isoprenylcysteine O-methyltransferase Ste14
MQVFRNQFRDVDVERVVLVPILVLLTSGNALGTVKALESAGSLSSRELLEGVYQLLVVLFYVMMIGLLLFRSKASSGSRSKMATVAAYLGTFTPFALVLEIDRSVPDSSVAIASIVLMTAGMVFSIYALACHGPYRLVRHPLYVGEVVAFFGIVLGRLTTFSVLVLVVLIILQTYRAVQEEKVLAYAFPAYTSYMRQTSRFIPGVV